jgi:hypothetical protein
LTGAGSKAVGVGAGVLVGATVGETAMFGWIPQANPAKKIEVMKSSVLMERFRYI